MGFEPYKAVHSDGHPPSHLHKGEDTTWRNFRREVHCNYQIVRKSELPDNLKLVLFYSSV